MIYVVRFRDAGVVDYTEEEFALYSNAVKFAMMTVVECKEGSDAKVLLRREMGGLEEILDVFSKFEGKAQRHEI